jgi:type II secretory pathway pseudopilin PulG
MAALLVALSVMGIMLGAALPAWRTLVQREREAELVFRGEQYVQAIDLYSRRNGGFPTSLNVLRDGRYIRKLYTDPMTNGDFQPVYLGQLAGAVPGLPGQPEQPQGRGAVPVGGAQQGAQQQTGIASPMGGTQSPLAGRGQPGAGAGQIGMPAGGAIIGVTSRSTGQSLRLYNGRGRYNEWAFVSTAATQQPGAPGAGVPGRGGRGPQPQGAQDGRGRGPQPQGGRGLQPLGGRGIGLDGPARGGPNRGLPTPPGRAMPFGAPN